MAYGHNAVGSFVGAAGAEAAYQRERVTNDLS